MIVMCEKKKDISRVAHEAAEALIKLSELANEADTTTKLLTIEIDDINSVPVVHYKGEKLNPISEFDLTWKTKTHLPGHISFDIEHQANKGHRERLGFERGFKTESSYGLMSSLKGPLVKHGDPGIDYAGPKGMDVPTNCTVLNETEKVIPPSEKLCCNIEVSGMDIVRTVLDHFEKRITESKINGS